jgi:hypothetical protein
MGWMEQLTSDHFCLISVDDLPSKKPVTQKNPMIHQLQSWLPRLNRIPRILLRYTLFVHPVFSIQYCIRLRMVVLFWFYSPWTWLLVLITRQDKTGWGYDMVIGCMADNGVVAW